MIIIPTEKRFDWKHTPVVLFSLVIINIVIFFIPQSSDNEKIATAFIQYQEQNFLALEWPFLQQYLSESQQTKILKQLESQYQQQQYEAVIGHILFDADFYRYLRQDQYNYFINNDVGDWFFIREKINTLIQSTVMLNYGLVPSQLSLFSTLSYQFLHGNIMHLLGNLFFLIICGFAVEAAIGRWRFLLFYLICGICGGVLHALLNSKSSVPLVGASGAISGTMAMYLGLFRLKKIEFFYWFFVFVGYFRAPALLILVFYIGKELYQLFSDNASNVAFLAHLGGFVAGGALIFSAYKMSPAILNQEYIEEDQSIDPLQEKKATIYEFLGKYQFDAAEKALTRTIAEQGLSFELGLIRYNIEKIHQKDPFVEHLTELLTLKNLDSNELDQLNTIWHAQQENLMLLDSHTQLRIALNLSDCSSPQAAVSIFNHLREDITLHPHLAIIAKKLSITYGRENNYPLQKKYQQIQNTLLAAKLSP